MLGITSVQGSPLPLAQQFAAMKTAGFDAVMLWWGSSNGDTREKLVNIARDSGLYIENVHAPTEDLNVLWEDNPAGDARLNALIEQVADCTKLGVDTIVMHLTTGSTPPPVSDVGTSRIEKLIRFAEKQKVKLAFENVRTASHVAHVLDRFQSPYAGFCYDSGHENLWTPETDWLSKYASRLFALHLHDNAGDRDAHMIPFDGTIDWHKKVQLIGGYTGIITLESQFHTSGLYQIDGFECYLEKAYTKANKIRSMIQAYT